MLGLAIAVGVGASLVAFCHGQVTNPTEQRLIQELDNLRAGKTASKAGKHILGTNRDNYKKNRELFSFSEPQRLLLEETNELVWSVTLRQWDRARDKFDDNATPTYTEVALFYDTPKGTMKPYLY